MTHSSPARKALLPVLLVLLVAAVFGHAALTSGFVSDDVRFIVENARLHEDGALLRALIDPRITDPGSPEGIVRPLRTAEFVLDARLGGSAAVYHVHSLAWHALAVVLLFFLLRALLGWTLPARSDGAAFAGAAIWAVHPMQVESVLWASSRGDVAMGACVFAALLLALRSRGRDRYFVLSLAMSFVAMLYKETAFVLPLLVFAVRLARPAPSGIPTGVPSGRWPRIAAAARSARPWLVVAAAYWIYRDAVRAGPLSHTTHTLGGSVAGTFATMFKGFAAYIGFVLVPVRPALDWMLPLSTTLTDPIALLCLGIHAALVATAVWAVRRVPAVSTAICFFYFALLPVSNWPFRIGIPTAERFLYVPLAGLAVLVAAGVAAAARKRRSRRRIAPLAVGVAVAVAVACLATGTLVRAPDWKSNEASSAGIMRVSHSPRALTETAAHKSRAGWRLLQLARASTDEEKREQLAADGRAKLEEALAVALDARATWLEWAPVGDIPGHYVHLADEAAAFAALGLERHDDALRFADRALALNARAPRAHYARAWSLLEKGRSREAVAAMLAAEENGIDLGQREYVIFFGRAARAFAKDGRLDEARQAYGKALALGVAGPATDAVRRELRALDGR